MASGRWAAGLGLVLSAAALIPLHPLVRPGAPLPAARYGVSLASDFGDDRAILLFGGRTTNATEALPGLRWDPDTAAWQLYSTDLGGHFAEGGCSRIVPEDRSEPYVLCFGGYNETNGVLGNTTTLRPNGTTRTHLDYVPVASFGSTLVGTDAWHIVGGYMEFWAPTPNGSKWYTGASQESSWWIPKQREFFSGLSYPWPAVGVMCASLGPSVLCCGGAVNDTTEVTAACHRAEFEALNRTSPWTPAQPLPEPRAFGCCVTFPGWSATCCAGGGRLNDSSLVTSVDCFDWDTERWHRLPRTVTGRFHVSCIANTGNEAHFVGGSRQAGGGSGILDTHETLLAEPPPCTSERPSETGNGLSCEPPPFTTEPAAPMATAAFTVVLPSLYGSGAGFELRLAPSLDCADSIPGTSITPVAAIPGPVANATGASFTVNMPQAVYVCFRERAGNAPSWYPLLPSGPNPRRQSALLIRPLMTYRTVPVQPLENQPFRLTLSGPGTFGGILSATKSCHTPKPLSSPGNFRLSSPEESSSPASAVLRSDSCADPTVCVLTSDGVWLALLPEDPKRSLSVLAKSKGTAAAGTGTAATAVVTSVAAMPAVVDTQLLALLGELDCAPRTLRSYNKGSGWLLAPFSLIPLTPDPYFNNMLGVVIFLTILQAVALIVDWVRGTTFQTEAAALLRERKPLSLCGVGIAVPRPQLVAVLFLYQGLVIASIKVMSGTSVIGPDDQLAVGFTAVAVFIVLPLGFLFYAVRFHIRLHRQLKDANPPIEYVAFADTGHSVQRLFPTHHWTNLTKGYISAYGVLFSEYRPSAVWFLVVTCLRTLVISVIIGSSTAIKCTGQLVGISIVLAFYAFGLLWLRPFRDLIANIVRGLVAALQFVAAISGFLATPDHLLKGTLGIATALLICDFTWSSVRWLYEIRRSRPGESGFPVLNTQG